MKNYFLINRKYLFGNIFLSLFLLLAVFFGAINTLGLNINGFICLEFFFLSATMILIFIQGLTNKKDVLLFVSIIIFYIFISFFLAVNNNFEFNIFDFLVIYKFLFFFILISIWFGKEIFSKELLHKFQFKLIFIFLFFYFIQKFLFDIARPQVFGENNFELILLLIIFFFSNVSNKNINITNIIFMGGVIFLSSSRSAAVIYLLSIIFMLISKKITIKSLFIVFLIFLSCLGVLFIFSSRLDGDIDSIDRVNMLNQLLYIVKNWDLGNWLFGVPRITPLPQEVCNALSFYDSLFSYANNGKCYSVILHAFNMRIIYDHGLIVSFLTFYFVWILMGRKRDLRTKLFVLLALIATGFSVSSLNSVFVAISLAILLSTVSEEK